MGFGGGCASAMIRDHYDPRLRLPYTSELPRRVRMRRHGDEVSFVYRDGTVMTTSRWQATDSMIRQVWAAMPRHGRKKWLT